jgi:hypothetical protein
MSILATTFRAILAGLRAAIRPRGTRTRDRAAAALLFWTRIDQAFAEFDQLLTLWRANAPPPPAEPQTPPPPDLPSAEPQARPRLAPARPHTRTPPTTKPRTNQPEIAPIFFSRPLRKRSHCVHIVPDSYLKKKRSRQALLF